MFSSNPRSALTWRAQEVVREVDDQPHLLARIEIEGDYFPHRAAEPFVRILDGDQVVMTSWFADVSDDNRRLTGYFPVDLPPRGTVEFGYGHQVMGRIPLGFDADAVIRLDRQRLPGTVVPVSAEYLKAKQGR
jgi:hypothetical protein